jgi:GNAT superfamily N-acetyltransferase
MSVIEQNLWIHMIRSHLDDIPDFELPMDYRIRSYSKDDIKEWVRIQSAADRYNHIDQPLFYSEFSHDHQLIRDRQLYLIDRSHHAIGTATAWYDACYHGEEWGRIHWVAILPAFQGRGLAKPLMTAACQRLRRLGHSRAYLVTSTGRVEAICLYLLFGFTPDIRNNRDAAVWKKVMDRIDCQHGKV